MVRYPGRRGDIEELASTLVAIEEVTLPIVIARVVLIGPLRMPVLLEEREVGVISIDHVEIVVTVVVHIEEQAAP